MDLMAMARNLLTIYVSIEIVSVISFLLAGFKEGDRKSAEAALKYVVFGGVSSGVMLYGMSWLYGFSRSLSLPAIAERVALVTREQGHLPNAVVIGAACVLAGFAYKISAVPFHMWAPDVYEGSPTVVAAFFSVGPKAAGFAVLVRFFHDALQAQTAVSGSGSAPWPILGGLLAAATMTIGNLSALEQTNLKRMLAYSSIAHAGYMLLAFTVFTADGIAAIFFYIVAYCSMNLGAFLVVMAVAAKNGGDETLEGVRGLGTRAPAMAIAMTIFLFSLVGLPPFSGFVGKLYIFTALLRAGGAYQGWYWVLAAIGVVNSVISLVYYARVLRVMYLTPYLTPHATLHLAPGAVPHLTPPLAQQPTWSPEPPEPPGPQEPEEALSAAAGTGHIHGKSTETRGADAGRSSDVSVHKLHGALALVLVIPTVALGVYWGPLYDFILRSLSMVQ
jgi:NADH-quinone oxidoreductase subunit N